jgi:hypothetical protein
MTGEILLSLAILPMMWMVLRGLPDRPAPAPTLEEIQARMVADRRRHLRLAGQVRRR